MSALMMMKMKRAAMSVDYSAELWYGVPLAKVDMNELSQERIEEIVENYSVLVNDWINTDDSSYFGIKLCGVDEIGESAPISPSQIDSSKIAYKFWSLVNTLNLKVHDLPQYYLIQRVW